MKISFRTKDFNLNTHLTGLIERKLKGLDRHTAPDDLCTVSLTQLNPTNTEVEIAVGTKRGDFRAHCEGKNALDNVDKVIARLTAQMTKDKEIMLDGKLKRQGLNADVKAEEEIAKA